MARLGLIALETELYAIAVIQSATPKEDGDLMFVMQPTVGSHLVERLTKVQDQGLQLLEQDICYGMRSTLEKLNTQMKMRQGIAIPPGPSSGDPWRLRALAEEVLDRASPVARLEEEARDALNETESPAKCHHCSVSRWRWHSARRIRSGWRPPWPLVS
ncbi:hypothetical protein CS8_089190 [Cupriavidus sp. 8B]